MRLVVIAASGLAAVGCGGRDRIEDACTPYDGARDATPGAEWVVSTYGFSSLVVKDPTGDEAEAYFEESTATVTTAIIDADAAAAQARMPSNANHAVWMIPSARPQSFEILKRQGTDNVFARRYVDTQAYVGDIFRLFLCWDGPQPVRVYPGGLEVAFTAEVTGAMANDVTPPEVSVTAADGAIVVTATDAESGMQQTLVSVNGGAYTPYTAPIEPPVLGHTIEVWVLADDKAGNRTRGGPFTVGPF